MSTRMETDSLGAVAVPAECYWGAQTQRSLQNFRIGEERMPLGVVRAFGAQKKAAALANGFWHMGEFSKVYKTMFGEMPSETLVNARYFADAALRF